MRTTNQQNGPDLYAKLASVKLFISDVLTCKITSTVVNQVTSDGSTAVRHVKGAAKPIKSISELNNMERVTGVPRTIHFILPLKDKRLLSNCIKLAKPRSIESECV